MAVLPYIVSGICVFLVTIILFFKWSFTYWSKRKVFTLPPVLPFGNAKALVMRNKTFGETVADVYYTAKEKGHKYAGFYFLFQPIFVPVDINLIRQIMSVDFQHFTDHTNLNNEKLDPLTGHLFALKGAKWKALRTKLSPLFSSGKLKMMFQTLVDCSKGLEQMLDESVIKDEPFDIKQQFALYTTDVIGSVAFGIDINCLKNPDNEFRFYGKKSIFPTGIVRPLLFFCSFIIPSIFQKFNISLIQKDVESFFINIVKETIEYRDNHNIERKDFIQLFMKLRSESLKVESSIEKNEENIGYYQNGLTINEIAAQAFVFFVAGYETSSSTMNFLMYELTQNLNIQDKLIKEINSVIDKHDGRITYEAVKEMHYLDNCVSETLRKYSSLSVLTRECTKDYKIPDSDVTIKKGTASFIPARAVHYDPEFYPDPEKFDPDRFLDENKSKRPQFTYLPFGEGPRLCIGLRLGLLQTKVGMIALLKNHKFTLNPKTKTPIMLDPTQFLTTVKGKIWVDVNKNDHCQI